MNNFTHNFIWILLVAGIGALGYWGWFGLSESTSISYVGQIENITPSQNETPEIPEIAFAPEEVVVEAPAQAEQESPRDLPEKYTQLASSLQKLIDDKVEMKPGSVGTRVGVVQQFLNAYEGKDVRPDNDYGEGTKAQVSAFQKSEGLDADGLAGVATYQKMLAWLAR